MAKKYINENFKKFLHGADYNPEQWLDNKEIWDEDMRLMKLANCNEMSVGIFSWATLEPEEGVYDFSFLDEIIEKVYNNGGKIVLATPSGARPRWLAEKYPEVLRVNSTGIKNRFGARHNHCYTSPIYREKVKKINTLLAERYGNHPAVVAFHISNEYGGECYCPLCQNAFKKYLKEKYGDIKKLNYSYWAKFWSHDYQNFEQIEPPMENGEKSIHGLNLDWRRFVSYQTLDFMKEEIKAIKSVCPNALVTTNMMPAHYPLNYREFAKELDIISWDSYPDWGNGNEIDVAVHTAFWHDFFRSLLDKPFMLMESAPALVNWKPYNKLKRPNLDVLQSLQAVSHGSDTVQYFQWRKSRGSVEKFHGAVVDHLGNENTRIFGEVKKTGEILNKIEKVVGSNAKNKIGIIFDWENMWALDDSHGFQKNDKKYQKTCVDYYKPFWENSIGVDIIGVDSDFSKYSLIIAPMLYMVKEETIEKIEKFVKGGGAFYATYTLGMVNETDLCYLGGFPAGKLKEVFGIWNEEIDSLYPQDRGEIVYGDKTYEVVDYAEIIHLQGGESLAKYNKEFYKGKPCYTVNSYGKGKAYYQAFRDTGDFKENALIEIAKNLGIKPNILSKINGVTAQKRFDDDCEYLFVENFNDNSVLVDLDGEYTDMLNGESVKSVSLENYGIKILTKKI